MATVFDNFNRPDNPTSLGTATTGQVWALFGGTTPVFGIASNQAFTHDDGMIGLETGMSVVRCSVKLMNADAGTLENLRNQGIFICGSDATHWINLTYARAGGGLLRLYIADGGTSTHVGPDCSVVLADGDTLELSICGQLVDARINGVSQQNYPFVLATPLSPTLRSGTICGLQAAPGTLDPGSQPIYEDFTVEANAECITYDCSEAGCVFNPDGLGEFNSLAACEASCGITPSYNCLDGVCCDPGDGSGEFATLAECQASGCAPPPPPPTGVETRRFDAGLRSSWWLLPQLSDSGIELRDKTIKAVRITGKVTNASFEVYGYGATEELDIASMIDGTNSRTGDVPIPDTTGVVSTKRFQVRVPRSALHTVRVEGEWDGEGIKDRIDEIEYEIAEQGARR